MSKKRTPATIMHVDITVSFDDSGGAEGAVYLNEIKEVGERFKDVDSAMKWVRERLEHYIKLHSVAVASAIGAAADGDKPERKQNDEPTHSE